MKRDWRILIANPSRSCFVSEFVPLARWDNMTSLALFEPRAISSHSWRNSEWQRSTEEYLVIVFIDYPRCTTRSSGSDWTLEITPLRGLTLSCPSHPPQDREDTLNSNIPMHLGLLSRFLSTSGFPGDRRGLPIAYGINRVPHRGREMLSDQSDQQSRIGLLISRVRSEWSASPTYGPADTW